MPDSCFHSGFHTGFLELWNSVQASLNPLRFGILVLEFTKHKHTLRISYTIVIPRRNVLAVRIRLLYSALLQLTCRNKSEITQVTAFLRLSVQEL